MPYEVLCALEDALKIRRQYHSWYTRQLSEDSSEEDNKGIKQSNEAHKVFIDFLQCIHDLFAPAKTSDDEAQPHTQSKEKILEITNFFANLEVEAVADEDIYDGTVNYPSGAQRAVKPWMAKKSQMFDQDKFLELYCLYEDANKIREYLRQTWAEYASRKIDINSAALTTQVALELFCEIEESFEEKYGTVMEYMPDSVSCKYQDLYSHLAIGEPARPMCTRECWASKTAAEKEAAKLRAQSVISDRWQRYDATGWKPSEDLEYWVMQPAIHALQRMIHRGDDWVLKQACRTPADRAGDLDALVGDVNKKYTFQTTVRELLDTFIDVYAGMVFLRNNPRAFIRPGHCDIISLMWLNPYDCSIRMQLSMQILHDIRTASSGVGQLDILTQVSEDYKTLGRDVAVLSDPYSEAAFQQPGEVSRMLREQTEKERGWLQGRIPGNIEQLGKKKTKASQKISGLPLLKNPVLAGMVLFNLAYQRYGGHITYVNHKWFLVPSAHLVNWLSVTDRKARAEFQKIWPDLHTALGMIGPRPVWVGSGQPEDPRTCRNRMLLAWGLPLTDFYRRMASGDIPKTEELFNRIKNNRNDPCNVSPEQLEACLSGAITESDFLKELNLNRRRTPPLSIEPSQPAPLLEAFQINLHKHMSINAQQSHIREIVLAYTATARRSATSKTAAKTSGGKRKGCDESDMMSYLQALSRVVQAEMPRLLFPYDELSRQCGDLSSVLFGIVHKEFDLSADIRGCGALAFLKEMRQMTSDKLGTGAQSVSSLLALATMFGDRIGSRPVERPMLRFMEEQWDEQWEKENVILRPNRLTERFVEKCKSFGLAVPECATEALSSGEPTGQLT